jgi:hypothetical protein
MSTEEKIEKVGEEVSEPKEEETEVKAKKEIPPKGGKYNKKKILKLSAAVLALIILLLVILSIALGTIIKGTVNHVLPAVTGTPSGMGSCYLNIFTGTLNIKDFVIGNPKGYETAHAFKLGEVHVDIALTSLLSDKIVIEDIIVDNMEVSFETKLTETNIGVIKDNIDKLSKKDESAETGGEEEPAVAEEEEPGAGKKLQIDNFMFINSKVNLHAGVGTSVPLPEIKIQGIGADSDEGASVPEISEEVFNELYLAILKAAKSIGNIDTEGIKEGTDKAIEKAKEGTENVIKGVKGLFGGEKE